MSSPSQLSSWKALEVLAQKSADVSLSSLFEKDPERFDKYAIELPYMLLDYSKNRIDDEVKSRLIELAEQSDLVKWRSRFFNAESINKTEQRPVLHMALRGSVDESLRIDEDNISELVNNELAAVKNFVRQVRSGEWRGYTGKWITDVVTLGVGGSNLGPQMISEALRGYSDNRFQVHYVSNADGVQINNALTTLNPHTTLFIISSKTFTTAETMRNANTAKHWLEQCGANQGDIKNHFVAVTADAARATRFGISADNIFSMWDWVGGRFSLWSSIGLPIALELGFDMFARLLDGANMMDKHFQTAPFAENAPVMLALVGIWNSTFLGRGSHAILPYDQSLHMLPAYLQQAEMESNGKSVRWSGEKVDYSTCPILWGQLGINGQHAFYQLLHQGTQVVPADFIGSVESVDPVDGHHDLLMANFFAQTQALMDGVNERQVADQLRAGGTEEERIAELVTHKVHQGNRPSNTILLDKITPESIGALVAMYEHKIFVQGVIWQVCSFDQWGVELGKMLAKRIEKELHDETLNPDHDSSTRNLIDRYKRVKGEAKK
ncbi:glucose-6-phosphate isomerase [Sinobacterium caligoides]|uniref:Glucose-6-phosphate isomerase n=1 Tax=Sinobacterium caligoides TaxID=933926 RepID=A0A3N2DNZ6_9GAMM|nr:glucose-6-phosphate isomerase [Sinobacterium caligoides]ROS01422.1 glucose-6-phosphate isomerase [Sinobacterium caligoides]